MSRLVLETWRSLPRQWLPWSFFVLFFSSSVTLIPTVLENSGPSSLLEQPVLLAMSCWLCGAGIVGRARLNGILALVLVRPVLRWRYLLAKGFALWSAVVALWFLLTLLSILGNLAFAGLPEDLPSIPRSLGSAAVAVLPICCVALCLSTLLPPGGDFGVWFLALMLGGLANELATQWKSDFLTALASGLGHVLVPRLEPSVAWGGSVQALENWSRILGMGASALALASFALSRSELVPRPK